MEFICEKCKKTYPIDGLKYKCDCNGFFKLYKQKGEKLIDVISLGEVETPVLEKRIYGMDVFLKMDYMMPTGSFKDRGAKCMINKLKELGIKDVVEDSSGNAAASIAAYCAAANIKCNIFIPENTSPSKIKQITTYGAKITKVPGSRDDVSQMVVKAAEKTYYASHIYNPLFIEGVKSIVYELIDQIGVPDYIVTPVGNGTLLLGIFYGFEEMGVIPKIIAVQSENCSPIFNKFYNLKDNISKETIAEGIAIQNPAKINEIIQAIKKSEGDIIIMSDEEIKLAHKIASQNGIYLEYTSAVAVAGIKKYFKNKSRKKIKVVIPLTGTGLKK